MPHNGLEFCRRIAAFGAILLLASLLSAGVPGESLLREGDVIFHESLSPQAKAIRLATGSRYTHVGILFRHGGSFAVFEAVQPVKVTPLRDFIRRGRDGHYVIKRLRNYDSVMSAALIDRMKQMGRSWLGKNYDWYFEWSDRRIYCTELVWKLYERAAGVRVGKLSRLGDHDLSHPYVRKILRRRYGSRIPLNEKVITPRAMFEAENLVTVISAP